MQTAAGRREMQTAGGRRSLLEIKSVMNKVAAELDPLLDAVRRNITLEKGKLGPRVEDKIQEALELTEDVLKDGAAQLMKTKTRTEAMTLLEEQGMKVDSSTTDTQVMLIFFEYLFDSIIDKLKKLREILHSSYVLDSNPTLSELFKKTQGNLTRTKLETRIKLDKIDEALSMEMAEGSQVELVFTSPANEMGEEGGTCIEKTELEEIEETNVMGEESATFNEAAELEDSIEKKESEEEIEETSEMGDESSICSEAEIEEEIEETSEMGDESFLKQESSICSEAAELEEAAEGKMEEMHTNQFFDICCRAFQTNLSKLFIRTCNHDDTTSLSPMHFTLTTPPGDSVASTLQIFYVEVEDIKQETLRSSWPLHVYGTVVARDTVDRNRNILFHRSRNNCQILNQKARRLQLTGPSRAIAAIDPVDFDIELKVKGSKKSPDRVLMRQTFNYSGGNNETTLLSNDYCQIMLRCAKLEKTVQATIVAVRVMNRGKRAWPFKHGVKVSCVAKGSSKHGEKDEEVLLQHLEASTSLDGYLDLSRRVVSVDLSGELRVIIRSSKYSNHVFFPAQECKSSRRICHLGPYEVEVTVAWSLLIRDKRCISKQECVDDGQAFEHTADKIQRRKTTLESQSTTQIYSLLDFISKNAMKLKAEPKLRISDYSTSEVQIHMDNMYINVASLLRMMEIVHTNRDQEPVMEKMGLNTGTGDTGESATEMQAPRTYYEYGLNAIFNGLDQLCTQLDQMGYLSYKGKSQSFSDNNITKIELDEIEPLTISMETVEAAKGKGEVSLRISSSTDIKLEKIEEAKEMGGEDEDSDVTQTEEECFESYRRSWVSNWSIYCGAFTEKTSLSPMHFTHSTPRHSPFGAMVDCSLQIYSIKVTKIEQDSGLTWPLQVYGVVAARDTADRNRNILFSRQRNNCQELTQQDPFLRLTGPSRAIVTWDPAHVEIELKVKGGTKSEDSVLMSHVWYYSSSYLGLRTLYTPLEGDYCTIVLSAEELEGSVQATMVGIRVCVPEGRPNPFEYGGRVVCSSLPRRKGSLPDKQHIAADPSFRQVVLQEGAMTTCSEGYLNLSRHVVSVELRGKLEVVIEARSRRGAMAGKVVVSIDAQECNITEDICQLGDSELTITVAWSRLVHGKEWISTSS